MQLDARTVVKPQPAWVEINTRCRTVGLMEPEQVRVWPFEGTRMGFTPWGRTLVLGELSSSLGDLRRGLLLAAHVRGDDDGGLTLAGAHRWAVAVHDSEASDSGLRVSAEAMSALLGAAPAGTTVLIH
ncbi:hypothetical protein [Actinokineospora sp. NPDC004072]